MKNYCLILKATFDAFSAPEKVKILMISNSMYIGQFRVVTLSGSDYYVIEASPISTVNTLLFGHYHFNETEMLRIIDSGIFVSEV